MAFDYKPKFGYPISPWYKIFAWLPTNTIDRGWVWMRTVYKRRIQKHDYLYGGSDFWWQYISEIPEGKEIT